MFLREGMGEKDIAFLQEECLMLKRSWMIFSSSSSLSRMYLHLSKWSSKSEDKMKFTMSLLRSSNKVC